MRHKFVLWCLLLLVGFLIDWTDLAIVTALMWPWDWAGW
jgi:hypothetical protein